MALLSKRDQPMDDGHWPPVEPKKGRFEGEQQSRPPPPRVVLNPADCDLDFNVEDDGLHGSALYEKGFAYCWSGARANVGIFGGKYCFGCKIIGYQPVQMDDTPGDLQHLCRVGVSLGDDAMGTLGETRSSFGFGGTGELPNSGSFPGYLEKFLPGDNIICCVDLDSKPALVCFTKNRQYSGIAKQFDAGPCGIGVAPTQKLALFPHICLKNVVVQMQFSAQDGLVPPEGYKPWSSAFEDGKGILGPVFQNTSDCEVIMMVGLPASGKSTWAENWVKAHPEKRYILLGTNLALDKMKIPGFFCENNYSERFEWLMDRATKIFNTLLSRASKMPLNFIIDETNVYLSCRRRRLKPFADYHKIAVVVFPKLEELKERAEKRFQRTGKEVPAAELYKMIVAYALPRTKDMPFTDEYFDEVFFPELNRNESEICLGQMMRNETLWGEIYCKTGNGSAQTQDNSVFPLASMPPRGGPQQFYRASHDVTFIPSHLGSPHINGSLSGFGDWANSYSSQTPSAALSRNFFSDPPMYHLENERNYVEYSGHLQYGGNAAPGSMNEQHMDRGPGVTFTSTGNESHMNEPYGNMNPSPQYLYAGQPQGPPSQP